MYVETHEMFVSGCWMGTHGRPGRGGMGACIWLLFCTSAECEHSGDQGEAGRGLACMSRRIRNCSLDLLKVKARAITANKMGALAYLARSMLALLHIVQSAYMGSSFSLC